jgi:uncharacterized protein with FMN-binding domain
VSEREHKKVSSGLVALSAAAVLAVYTAGYVRTRSAADRVALQAEGRRPPIPPPSVAPAPPVEPAPLPAPATPPSAATPPARPEIPAPTPKRAAVKRPPRPIPPAAHTPVTPRAETAPAAVADPPVAAPAGMAVPEQVPAASIDPPAPPAAPRYKDGTYLGWGTSRHGDIQASVVIADGRIASATIAQCLTRYSCSVIARIVPQVAERQSPEVDYVSGATQSTNAFYYAVVDALSKAK